MRSFATLAFATVAAAAGAAPGTPDGCQQTVSGTFGFDAYYTSGSAKRQTGVGNPTGYTLNGGVFKDSLGRQANIVKNGQFQFDPAPGQPDAQYNAGFSVCQNNTIAIGNTAIFLACNSGDFSNIYLNNQAATNNPGQCRPVYLIISRAGGDAPGSGQQRPDGQLGASQIADGQMQAPTNLATQKADGQPQATPKAGATQAADGQPQASPKAGASQVADGQPQVSPKAGATQISDGQPQVSPKAGATQIADGQPQVSPKAGATQIADGQPQVSPKVAAPAPAAAGNSTRPATPATVNAAPAVRGDIFALFGAGLMAVLLL